MLLITKIMSINYPLQLHISGNYIYFIANYLNFFDISDNNNIIWKNKC